MKPGFKEKLLEACKALVRRKIEVVSFNIDEIREAMENETKSTVGDKHETFRARMQSEQENLTWQLDELKGQYRELERLDLERKYDEIATGCLVETDKACFYISIALGRIVVGKQPVFVISAVSPIAQRLHGLKAGQSFEFNNTSYFILGIF